MIFTKINKAIFILCVFFFTNCYKDPFFELSVRVLDQSLNPVNNAFVTVEISNMENGEPVSGSIINLEGTTNADGVAFFSFDNKAFLTVRSCKLYNETTFCKEGYVYLEPNINKELSLMLQSNNCYYCL